MSIPQELDLKMDFIMEEVEIGDGIFTVIGVRHAVVRPAYYGAHSFVPEAWQDRLELEIVISLTEDRFLSKLEKQIFLLQHEDSLLDEITKEND